MISALVLAAGTACVIAAALILPTIGFELVPVTDEGEVQVTAELPAPVSGAATAAAAPAAPHRLETAAAGGRIEITLPGGAVIRVGEEISLAALRRVVAALRA